MIAVTSPAAVRSVSSETTLSETIALIVPGIRFRMLVLMGSEIQSQSAGIWKGNRRPLLAALCYCCVESKKGRIRHVKDWEIIADNLSKAGWSWGCV